MGEQNGHSWVVMKFGGTSVSSVDCWSTICEQAGSKLSAGKRVMIVVSALSGVTNLLTRLAEGVKQQERDEILFELQAKHRNLYQSLGLTPSPMFEGHWNQLLHEVHSSGKPGGTPFEPVECALLLAHGELLSSSIGRGVLAAAQLDAVWQDARSLLKATAEKGMDVLAARCDDSQNPALEQQLAEEGALHITQGPTHVAYIGHVPDDDLRASVAKRSGPGVVRADQGPCLNEAGVLPGQR